VLLSIDTVECWYGASVLPRTHWSGSINPIPFELDLSTTCGCQLIQMRPLECHWKLPDGCFCCYCRPFPVRRLDWPNIGSVSLFREIQGSVPRLLPIGFVLSIQSSTRLSWSSCFLLWRSWSQSWSLEWVRLAFLYFNFKLPRHAVQWRPHSN